MKDSKNCLLNHEPYKTQREVKELKELIENKFYDSFLLDKTILKIKSYEDKDSFKSAIDIYDEFLKIYTEIKKYYSLDLLLILLENLLGERYKAFFNVYTKQFKEKKVSIKKFIKKFELEFTDYLDKYNIGFYPKGFTFDEEKNTKECLGETICYLQSIGEHEATSKLLELYNRQSLKKPKNLRNTIKGFKDFYIPKMNKKCGITKKAAEIELKNSIKKIKEEFSKYDD